MYKLMHSDFWLFELSVWLHVFSRALIAVFIPVLLLINGRSLTDVMIFYFLIHAINVPINFFSRDLVRRIGARWVIIFATLMSAGFFFVFYQMDFSWPNLVLLATLWALYDAFYWVAHLYLFIQSNNKKRGAGKGTSIFYIVRTIAGIAAPLVGAFILVFVSQKLLVAISMVILLLSLVPLFKLDHLHDIPVRPQKTFKAFFKGWREKRNYLSMGLYALHGAAENVLWPLFIYAVFGSIESVAYLPVIISITFAVFSYFAGKVHSSDRGKTIALGAGLIAITWILRLSIDEPMFYMVTVFLIGLFSVLVSIPLDSDLFERAKKVDPLSGSMYRNATSMVVKAVLYGALALVLAVFEVSFITAVVSLFALLVVNYFFLVKFSKTPSLPDVALLGKIKKAG